MVGQTFLGRAPRDDREALSPTSILSGKAKRKPGRCQVVHILHDDGDIRLATFAPGAGSLRPT